MTMTIIYDGYHAMFGRCRKCVEQLVELWVRCTTAANLMHWDDDHYDDFYVCDDHDDYDDYCGFYVGNDYAQQL